MIQQQNTETQQVVLAEYARLCSNAYGDPVNWARGLLINYANDTTDYTQYDGCDDVAQNNSIASDETSELLVIKLSPNPSTDVVELVSISPLRSGTVTIYDQQGRVLVSEGFTGTEKTMNHNLMPGVYIITVTEGSLMWSDKMIVIR